MDGLPNPPKTNRWTHVHVLCLEKETDRNKYNPLDLSEWEFFVIPTVKLDEFCGDQKSVSVGRLVQEGFQAVPFDEMKSETGRNRQH